MSWKIETDLVVDGIQTYSITVPPGGDGWVGEITGPSTGKARFARKYQPHRGDTYTGLVAGKVYEFGRIIQANQSSYSYKKHGGDDGYLQLVVDGVGVEIHYIDEAGAVKYLNGLTASPKLTIFSQSISVEAAQSIAKIYHAGAYANANPTAIQRATWDAIDSDLRVLGLAKE